jgi:Tol biopolymer transport system component
MTAVRARATRIGAGLAVLSIIAVHLSTTWLASAQDGVPRATPVPSPDYRIGYVSDDLPGLAANAAVPAGQSLPPPTTHLSAEQPSVRGAALAFVSRRPGGTDTDIWYQAGPARPPVPLTNDLANDGHPALSPDGTWIAFESDRAGPTNIWIISVTGTGLRRLTDGPADTWPTWSPDGGRIAFSSTGDDPAGDIFTIGADGRPATLRRLTSSADGEIQPAWSATDRIAYTSTNPARVSEIRALPGTTGAVAVRLAVDGEQATWSPDGVTFAYVRPSSGPETVDLLLGGGRLVTRPSSAVQTRPSWGPTGLTYATLPTETTQIESADTLGGHRAYHTDEPAAAHSSPAFSLDGQHLAYVRRPPAGTCVGESSDVSGSVMVANPDGTEPHEVACGPDVDDPAWSPDASMIAFAQHNVIRIVRVVDHQLLATVPVAVGTGDSQPTWAPDGAHLAFARTVVDGGSDDVPPARVTRCACPAGSTIWIATLSATDTGHVMVTGIANLSAKVRRDVCQGREVDDAAPAWSPVPPPWSAHDWIAFTARRSLCLVDPDTGDTRRLVANDATDPAWSPDATLIAYASADFGTGSPDTSIWTIPSGSSTPPLAGPSTPPPAAHSITAPAESPAPSAPPAGPPPTRVVVSATNARQPAFWPLGGLGAAAGLDLTITAQPQPSFVGTGSVRVTFTAHNTSRQTAYLASLVADAPGVARRTVPLGNLARGGRVSVVLTVPRKVALVGSAHGRLTARTPQDTPLSATAEASITVLQPVLRLHPDLGNPGFVPMATGTDFPPGATVTLAWNTGVPGRVMVTVGADGTFAAQVLVFPRDLPGSRRLIATVTGLARVPAPFLVVPENQQPRDFVDRY